MSKQALSGAPRAFKLGCVVGGIWLMLSLCPGASLSAESKSKPQEKPRPVRVATVAKMDVPQILDRTGTLKPESTVELRPQVSGQLMAVHFKEGDQVREGQVLFTVDPKSYKLKFEKAQAALVADRATLEDYRRNLSRQQAMRAKDYATQQDLEDAQAKVVTQSAQVRQDEATVELARQDLDWCQVRSPLDGRIGLIQVKPGNLVSSSDSTPLATITKADPIYVEFAVPEQYLSQLMGQAQAGKMAVQVIVPGQEKETFTGQTSFLNPQVDDSTGTVMLRGRLANREGKLWPGRFVQVRLTLSIVPQALVVPEEAVQMNQDGNYVYVLASGDKAELRSVQVGTSYQDLRVIEQGLKPGEQVVTFGQINLKPGSPLTVVQTTTGKDAPASAPAGQR